MAEKMKKLKSICLLLVFIAFLVPESSTDSTTDQQQIQLQQEDQESLLGFVPRGQWKILQRTIGVSAMHMQLLHNNRVVIFDRTDFGPSNLSFPSSHPCRFNPHDFALILDCTAHSVSYDFVANTFRPLTVQTDTWCSSGSVSSEGVLIQTGGYNDGERVIRAFYPCDDEKCDWIELDDQWLINRRWYASNQILPDGRIIVVGGRGVFSYEFFPKNDINGSRSDHYLRFLQETRDYKEENNLYPFLHILPDGNLFVFANRRSVLLDYVNHCVIREYPIIPGGDKRNYPSTGSSVLLPLRLNSTKCSPEAEILICGGAPQGSFSKALNGTFMRASQTCGRIKVTDPRPVWRMELMPMPRVMSDMLLLPNGEVIIVNGATNGTAGWENAVSPALSPILYKTFEPNLFKRFSILSPSRIPRMYHSAAVLLPDGRVLVGGSNPHRRYNFTSYPHPTELSLEAYSPYYLEPRYAPIRPTILSIETEGMIVLYNQTFAVTLVLSIYRPDLGLSVSILTPSFTTHSLALNQRLVILDVIQTVQLSTFCYKVVVSGPISNKVAPPGYYLLFLVHASIPSSGVWIKVH